MKFSLPDLSGVNSVYGLALGVLEVALAFAANIWSTKLSDPLEKRKVWVGAVVVGVALLIVGYVVIHNVGSTDKPCTVNQSSSGDYSPNINSCGSGGNDVKINSDEPKTKGPAQ